LAHLPQDYRLQRGVRVAVAVGAFLVIVFNSLTADMLPMEHVDCFKDFAFIATERQNQFLSENPQVKFAMMIICGLMMDFMIMLQFYRFAIHTRTWRFPIALISIYMIRFMLMVWPLSLIFHQFLFKMRYPEGYLWEFPGFYSLTVPYGKTNDFFFSGHIACCVVNMLEYRANK